MHRTQTFYEMPINPSMLLDNGDFLDIARRKVYSVTGGVSLTQTMKKQVLWILSINKTGELNFEEPDGIEKICPDGSIFYTSGKMSRGALGMYIILKNGAQQANWCVPVERINFEARGLFLNLSASLLAVLNSR